MLNNFLLLNAVVINSENIIKIGTVAAAIASIYGIIKLIAKPILNSYNEKKEYFRKFEEKLDKIEKQNQKNYIAVLQMKITSPHMPLEERLRAGHIYTDVLGQNGEVHIQYEMLQEEYKKENGKRFIYDDK